MAVVDDILQNLPIDQLAQQVGASPAEAQQAVEQALPALLGGLQANAEDAQGSSSIINALGDHNNGLAEGEVQLDQIDTQDGEKIASNIFGGNQDQVYSALSGSGGGNNDVLRKIIPILAPIVLSYLASKVFSGQGGLLGGGQPQTQTPQYQDQNPQYQNPQSQNPQSQNPQYQNQAPQGGEPQWGGEPSLPPEPTSAGGLDSILRDVLGGALGGQSPQRGQIPQQQQPQGGGILDILGGLLGGGRR